MADQTVSSSRGWVTTLAGLGINLALGVLYTWSIFTSKFTTVVQLGANGAVQKKGEALAGAQPILADQASAYGLKLAEGAKTGANFFVSGLVKAGDPASGYKTVKIAGVVLKDSAFNWTATQALLPYALCLLFFAFTMVFAGRLQDRFGPRIIASIGGVFVGAGMIIASTAEFTKGGNHMPLVLGFGVLTGMGIGLAYACATPAAVKWFHPSRRGLISGIVVAGFGLASVYTAPTTTLLISGQGLANTFLYLGIAFLIAIVLLAQLLKNPPAGYNPPVPANYTPPSATAAAAAATRRVDYTWREMMKTGQFYLLWLMYAFAALAGLMMIGLIAKLAAEQLSATEFAKYVSTGSTLASGFTLVVALALGNGLGRPVIGIVSDKIGRVPSMIIVFLTQAVLVALLLPNSHTLTFLLIVSFFIGAMYGANLTLFPAATFDFFGTKFGGVNYGLIFTAWGVGGAAGAYMAATFKDYFGSFTPAYYIAAGLLVVASVLALLVKAPKHEMAEVPEAAPATT